MRNVVIRQGALGDFILTLPLLRALAARGELHLFVPARYRALLPADLDLASFQDSDGAACAALFAAGSARVASAPLLPPWAELLRGAELHLFSRQPLTALSGVAECRLIYHEPRPTQPPHIALQFLQNAACAVPPRLLRTPQLPRRGQGKDILWIHAGSGAKHKNIPPSFWAERASNYLQDKKLELLLSFGEADLELLAPMRQACAERGLRWRELICPSLAELREQLSELATLFWSADTGVGHLAAALGIPCELWFRSSNPDIWRPLGAVQAHRYAADYGDGA